MVVSSIQWNRTTRSPVVRGMMHRHGSKSFDGAADCVKTFTVAHEDEDVTNRETWTATPVPTMAT